MLMSKVAGRPFLRHYAPAADDGNGDGVPYFCAKYKHVAENRPVSSLMFWYVPKTDCVSGYPLTPGLGSSPGTIGRCASPAGARRSGRLTEDFSHDDGGRFPTTDAGKTAGRKYATDTQCLI